MKLLPLLLLLTFAGCNSTSKEELEMTETAYSACKDAFNEAKETIRLQDEKIKLLEDKLVHIVDPGRLAIAVFADPYGTYCCDTVRTLNHTAIVKSVLDTSGNLTGFEIVKVIK